MTDDEFWAIIDAAKTHGQGLDDPFEGREEGLRERLEALEPARVLGFEKAFQRAMTRAYRWDLWGAAFIINGGCSDDGFTDFRHWLISMGRERFEGALADPQSLIDVEFGPGKEQDASFEGFGYVAMDVYETATGNPALEDVHAEPPHEPDGKRWKEDGLRELLPRLAASSLSQL